MSLMALTLKTTRTELLDDNSKFKDLLDLN